MSQNNDTLHLVAFIFAGVDSQSWRHPDLQSNAGFDFDSYLDYAKTAEKGLFDALLLADRLSITEAPPETVKRLSSVAVFEPLTLMSALAATTSHIGLIYTSSTTNNDPYTVARQSASLDHLSNGRAGWNLVTSAYVEDHANFSQERHLPHDERYERAEEFYDVVSGLWDSFEDDAFVHDKESGTYFLPEKMHRLDHKGKHFSVKGPLRIPRPVQGHPLVAQAGASEAGRRIAARVADLVFTVNHSLDKAKQLYDDIKQQAISFGREPDDIKILTGISLIWGETDEDAQRKFNEIADLVPFDVALKNLLVNIDLNIHDPDGPFPDLPETNGSHTQQRNVIEFARREKLTIRQTAQRLSVSNRHKVVVGSTKTIADQLEHWFREKGSDGFILMSPYLLNGFKEFVTNIVPELQRRGIYRTEYPGHTLRENVGVPRPPHRQHRSTLAGANSSSISRTSTVGERA